MTSMVAVAVEVVAGTYDAVAVVGHPLDVKVVDC
jgi:hypothetical protein